MDKSKLVLTVIFILILAFSAGAFYQQYKECEFNHGDFVKGVLFYKCINQNK